VGKISSSETEFTLRFSVYSNGFEKRILSSIFFQDREAHFLLFAFLAFIHTLKRYC
jgi:hypothetical protein